MASRTDTINGFEASKLLSDEDVSKFLAILPGWHISNPPVRSICYVNEVKYERHNNRRRGKEQILGQCQIDEEQGVGDITLYRQQEDGNNLLEDFKSSILHEIAHAVFITLPVGAKMEWYGLCVKGPFIAWNEAGRDPLEHFCDTYSYFQSAREFVQKVLPREFAFMVDRVFVEVNRNA